MRQRHVSFVPQANELESRELLSAAGVLRANALTHLDQQYLIQPGGFFLYGVKAPVTVLCENQADHLKGMSAAQAATTPAPAPVTPFQVWAAAHPWAARRVLWAARHR